MIVLDTNVLSETMQQQPSPRVMDWLARLEPDDVSITAISIAEIHAGIAVMPEGRKRRRLYDEATTLIAEHHKGVLVFDERAAMHYAAIFADRRRIGRPIELHDAMIAAICRHHGAALATRNVRDFDHVGIEIINPWDEAPDQDSASSGVR